MTYSRKNIQALAGYAPGEQPKDRRYIKLNTNENPYPPSPAVKKALDDFDLKQLKLYPDPTAEELRSIAGSLFGFSKNCTLIGNGSDDILTIVMRTFVDQGGRVACFEPSYSLYPVLTGIQGASITRICLDDNFNIPKDALKQAEGCPLFFIARPNAPTGNAFPREQMHEICRNFKGIILIDEAYADFSEDNCMDFVAKYPNVIISRTLSKSYSLAGVRLGIAVASEELISEMMKVKDSYNVNMLTQIVAAAALKDTGWMKKNRDKVILTRERLKTALEQRNFNVLPSQTNFLFTAPPENAAELHTKLKAEGILVRYFSGKRTGNYLRITIGTDEEVNSLLEALNKINAE